MEGSQKRPEINQEKTKAEQVVKNEERKETKEKIVYNPKPKKEE